MTVCGDAVDLSATEYEPLCLLSLRAGRVVAHQALLRWVWANREDPHPNQLHVLVRNLRRKLGDTAADLAYILNERKVGYRIPGPSSL